MAALFPSSDPIYWAWLFHFPSNWRSALAVHPETVVRWYSGAVPVHFDCGWSCLSRPYRLRDDELTDCTDD